MSASYTDVLEDLAKTRPRLAEPLSRSDRARAAHAKVYAEGLRLAGLDECLRHLDSLYESLEAVGGVPQISFLLDRARADYETALETALGGYPSVAHDAMRDVNGD